VILSIFVKILALIIFKITVKQHNFANIKFRERFIFALSRGFHFRKYVKLYMYVIEKFDFRDAPKIANFAKIKPSRKYVALQYRNSVKDVLYIGRRENLCCGTLLHYFILLLFQFKYLGNCCETYCITYYQYALCISQL